ncbi:MAG TPA: hypothetical protein VHC72_01140 [Bryobacteraceae bacterium]|nr:hypothetical protein [Bryobacteraceae bacterium]
MTPGPRADPFGAALPDADFSATAQTAPEIDAVSNHELEAEYRVLSQ